LGSGKGGGVELTLANMWAALTQRGHFIQVIAPQYSQLPGAPVIAVEGVTSIPAQTQTRTAPIDIPGNSVLANMWWQVQALTYQQTYDLVVNFAYDWLPLYLTPFLSIPVAHLISMGSLTDAMDEMIRQIAQDYPYSIGVHTQAQAHTFPCAQHCYPVGNGLDLSRYQFSPTSASYLCWLGRIAPEKALEDAVAAVARTGLPLKVMGHLQDQAYFEQIRAKFPQADLDYLGFLNTDKMQQVLRHSQGLLVTPRWMEAFGNVVMEALACGVPVIAYNRGGPAEILRQGETGWLVEPDSVEGLVEAIHKLPQIDRHACRQQAEEQYSLQAFADRLEEWFQKILQFYPQG
jgi:UDP-glucose:tetrahydrobiopterin glucosyltransferase